MKTTAPIHYERLADAKKLLARFAKKAQRFGVKAPKIVAVGKPYSRVAVYEPASATSEKLVLRGVFDPGDHRVPRKTAYNDVRHLVFVDVTIDGDVPRLNGWTLEAVIDHTAGGVIHRATFSEHDGALPKRFRESIGACEHCGHMRRRNTTYALRSAAGGWIEVGSTCLEDFTGSADTAAALAALSALQTVLSLGTVDEDGANSGGAFGGAPLRAFLRATLSSIHDHGFRSRGEYAGGSTADAAILSWKDFTKATSGDTEQTISAMLEWAAGLEQSDNDYLYNLFVATDTDHITPGTAGLVASIPTAYQRHLNKLAEDADRIDEILPGTVMGRYDARRRIATRARVIGLFSYTRGGFGYKDEETRFVCKLRDPDGRDIIWDSAGRQVYEVLHDGVVNEERVEIGVEVWITGKAVGSEYRGQLQTKVFRPTLVHQSVIDGHRGRNRAIAKYFREYADTLGRECPAWAASARKKKAA